MQVPNIFECRSLGKSIFLGLNFYSTYAPPRIQIMDSGFQMPDELKLQCVSFEKKHSFAWRL